MQKSDIQNSSLFSRIFLCIHHVLHHSIFWNSSGTDLWLYCFFTSNDFWGWDELVEIQDYSWERYTSVMQNYVPSAYIGMIFLCGLVWLCFLFFSFLLRALVFLLFRMPSIYLVETNLFHDGLPSNWDCEGESSFLTAS